MCILAVGKMLAAARDAAEALAAEGIEATVWDVRVVPLDPEMLADAAEHPVVLTAEDGIRDGGVGSLDRRRPRLLPRRPDARRSGVLGTPDRVHPRTASPTQILADLGLDADSGTPEAASSSPPCEPDSDVRLAAQLARTP